MKKRPVTTLFMLSSVDGKISTGASDCLDVDLDYPKMAGVREGLYQYYEIEKTTDLWSLNSGRVQAKIGVNERTMPEKTAVSFVLIDNKWLNENGIRYFCALAKDLVLVTTNPEHPAYGVKQDNLHIIFQEQLDLAEMMEILATQYHCDRITIQTGGTLNGLFLREKLFDYIDIVIAPVLIGGKDTAGLIDGESIMKTQELDKLGVLILEKCELLTDSYLHLRYRVQNR